MLTGVLLLGGLRLTAEPVDVVIDCPTPDVEVQCGASTDPDVIGGATATATGCSEPVEITYVDRALPADSTGRFGIERIWTASACGVASTLGCIQEIIFVGCSCGTSFYDANANGLLDAGETGIKGVSVILSQSGTEISSTKSDAAGRYCFAALEPGQYTVAINLDDEPCQPTTASSLTVTLGPAQLPDFGLVCLGAGGSKPLDFWTGKGGLHLLNDSKPRPTDLTVLRRLNLRTLFGTPFDPGSGPQVQAWLGWANRVNMAYALSAQLAVAALNVKHEHVNGAALVYAPLTSSANALGYSTIEALLAEANEELGLHGLTLEAGPGSAARPYQASLTAALWALNSDISFVQAP